MIYLAMAFLLGFIVGFASFVPFLIFVAGLNEPKPTEDLK